MDPWRDYPKFTDGALDAFIKRFPSHPDHAAAVAELERRRKERHRRSEGRSDQVEKIPFGKGILMWAIAGIAILALRSFPGPADLYSEDSPCPAPSSTASPIPGTGHARSQIIAIGGRFHPRPVFA